MMHRHSTDLVGLLFGLAFTVAGACFLVREVTDTKVEPAWAIGFGFMLLGTVALVATLARGFGEQRSEPAVTHPDLPETETVPESDG
jgi:hypothetical protein